MPATIIIIIVMKNEILILKGHGNAPKHSLTWSESMPLSSVNVKLAG